LRVAFFYLNVSTVEDHPWLARVEIPYWISQQQELVGLIHAVRLSMPRCSIRILPLFPHRAHELAVVKQAEYEEIENLLLAKFRKAVKLPATGPTRIS
jgi:hypothetical protein